MTHLKTPKEIKIEVEGQTFAAKVWGDEKGLPVLAMHGWLDNANTFNRLVPFLEGLHLVCLDMAGHGYSDHRPPRMHYLMIDYAMDAFDLVDALGWDRFALLGHSLGGVISMLMAACMPKRITHMASIESLGPISSSAKQFPEQLAKSIQSMQKIKTKRKNIFKTIDDAVKARMAGIWPLSEGAARILVERGLKRIEEGYVWNTDQRLLVDSPYRLTEDQIQSAIKNISSPACVILGENGLWKESSLMQERMSLMPHLQLHRLPGHHHLHLEEQAEEIAVILNQFYAQPVQVQTEILQ